MKYFLSTSKVSNKTTLKKVRKIGFNNEKADVILNIPIKLIRSEKSCMRNVLRFKLYTTRIKIPYANSIQLLDDFSEEDLIYLLKYLTGNEEEPPLYVNEYEEVRQENFENELKNKDKVIKYSDIDSDDEDVEKIY